MHQFEPAQEQRMTDDEAQAVLRVIAERQRQTEDYRGRPSVQDVATLANVPISDVHSALAEVRANFVPVVTAPKPRNLAVPVIATLAVFAIFIVFIMSMSMSARQVQVVNEAPVPMGNDAVPPTPVPTEAVKTPEGRPAELPSGTH